VFTSTPSSLASCLGVINRCTASSPFRSIIVHSIGFRTHYCRFLWKAHVPKPLRSVWACRCSDAPTPPFRRVAMHEPR
jgi:hypothetical protein